MRIVKIQRFSTHDGPGVRTVVFTKGCPLRCRWCHNPETQDSKRQIMFQKNMCIGCSACVSACPNHAHTFVYDIHRFDVTKCSSCGKCADVCVTNALEFVGQSLRVDEILSYVLRDVAFYGDNGGITLSGGEPMVQPEESITLLRSAKENGLSTAIETCGYFDKKYIEELCSVCDTFLWDFKDGIPERHKEYTGIENKKIIDNLMSVDKYAKNIILRCIIVRGVNNDEAHLDSIVCIYHRLKNCSGVEIIPYHAYAGGKAEQLGYRDNGNLSWIPTDEDMNYINGYLMNANVKLL